MSNFGHLRPAGFRDFICHALAQVVMGVVDGAVRNAPETSR